MPVRIIILLFICFEILSGLACAQIKPLPMITSGGSSPDVTTNIYVRSTMADDNGDGLTYATAKLYLGTGLSMVDSPTDSVFVSGTFHDSTYTITQGVVVAYSLTSKPIIFGADTLTGFTEVAGSSGAAIVDTFYTAASSDDGWRYGGTGYNKNLEYFELGKHYSSGTGFVRFPNVIERAVFDSAKIEFYAYITRNLGENTFRFYCEDAANPSTYPSAYADFDTRYATKTTAYKDTTFSNEWTDGTKYIYRCTEPVGEVIGSYSYTGSEAISMFIDGSLTTEGIYVTPSAFDFNSGAEKPKLIIYSHGLSSQQYWWKLVSDPVYQVYFGDTYGTEVSDKSLIDAAAEWCQSGDTLYVFSTSSGVIATLRNGFNITANATIAGIDFEKCNVGIKTSGTVDSLNLRQNKLYQNVYGIIDSADGTSLLDHNIFSNNVNNLYLKNKDTVYTYNNVFYSYYPSGSQTNLTLLSSKISFKNNAVFLGNPNVASIDNPSNILVWDYNAYGYYNGVVAFMPAGASNYDSLKEFQDSTAFDDHSFDVQSWKDAPYNSIIYWWDEWNWTEQTNFTPRIDTIGSYDSPLIDAGVNVGNLKDFNGSSINTFTDIGAIEKIVEPDAPTLYTVSMYALTDSAHLFWDYDTEIAWDSVTIYANNQYIETIAITNEYYHKPDSSTTTAVPEVYAVIDNQLGWQDSVNITAWITPNNSETTIRVRRGIGSLTDSTAGVDTFIYIPQTTVYKILVEDATYEDAWSNEQTLTYVDSVAITILLSGLSTDTTYTYDVTVTNAVGYAQSDNGTFRITTPAPPAPVNYDWYVRIGVNNDSTVASIAELNALGSAVANKSVAFLDADVFADAQLVCQAGATYTSYGGGQATIGDSLSTLTSNPTIVINAINVTLDNLKIYGYLNTTNVIEFSANGLTIEDCEIIGGHNSHEKWSSGLYQTSATCSTLTLTRNVFHGFGKGAVSWSRPYNADVGYNEFYDLWRVNEQVFQGASGIARLDVTDGNTPWDSWDCNYTVNIHNNNAHHFSGSPGFGGYSRMIIEYNEIHTNLDERIYRSGIPGGAVGKLWDTGGGGAGEGTLYTVTISIGSPAIVTRTNHGLSEGQPIRFYTTGTLPTGIGNGGGSSLRSSNTYYVKYINSSTFNVATSVGGTAINTSGTQSGTHSFFVPVPELGLIFRYNYVHDLSKWGEAGNVYAAPNHSSDRTLSDYYTGVYTGTVTTSYSACGTTISNPDYPIYLYCMPSSSVGTYGNHYGDNYNDVSCTPYYSESSNSMISGLGYAGVFIHNNIFQNISASVFGRGNESFNERRWDLACYFLNNTMLNCGSSYAFTKDLGIGLFQNYVLSPTHFYNNIIDYSNASAQIANRFQGDSVYLGYNIYFHQTDLVLSMPVAGSNKATLVEYRADDLVPVSEYYLVDFSTVYNDTSSTIFIAGLGTAGCNIPDVRIKVSGSAYNTGKAYSSLGGNHTMVSGLMRWSQVVTAGQDPTGTSFAVDITGHTRLLNHIGAVKAVGE